MRPHLLTQSADWWITKKEAFNPIERTVKVVKPKIKQFDRNKYYTYTATKDGQTLHFPAASKMEAALGLSHGRVIRSFPKGDTVTINGWTVTRTEIIPEYVSFIATKDGEVFKAYTITKLGKMINVDYRSVRWAVKKGYKTQGWTIKGIKSDNPSN